MARAHECLAKNRNLVTSTSFLIEGEQRSAEIPICIKAVWLSCGSLYALNYCC